MRLSSSTLRATLGVAAIAATSGVAACTAKKTEAATVPTSPVQRQNVVVDVEATGVIQPIGAVDVRSKASGQIIAMPVQTGSQVKAGDLLVRIDPRDPQQRYDQAKASVAAASAQLEVTKTQFDRNVALGKQGVITQPELESARIAYANAQSQVVQAKTQLELAQISLEDVTIQAPSAGTIISMNVAPGQVIASSTNSPSGGTILLTLANLATIYDSTLVNESDIGKVKPGQTASITVDAYPGRTFRGIVEKIEPRATVQQSVTMFPVKIRIENQDGALMPGMNSDVSILVEDRQDVIAVPVDAVRATREAGTAAAALGLDSNKVKEVVQQGGRGGAPGGRAMGGDTGVGAGVAVNGAAANGGNGGGANGAAGRGQGGGNGGGSNGGDGGAGGPNAGGRGGMGGPPPSAAACDSVTKAFAAHPKQRAHLDSLQAQMRSGALDFNAARETMRALYDSIGVDARTARGCRPTGNGQGGQGGGQGGQGGQGGGMGQGGQGGGGGAGGFAGGQGGGGGFGSRTGRGGLTRGLVFVKSGATYEPRVVSLGLGNFDVIEVTSGLKEGEEIALISGAVLQASRQAMQNRIRSNSGLPGMGGGAAGGRPASGGAPGGGGGPPGGGGGGGPRGG